MKKRNNFIFYILLIFTITSCKSQINNTVKPEVNTSIITLKDSILCKDGDDIFKLIYSLPKVSLHKNAEKINELIFLQIKANSELFEYLDNDASLTTELALKSMFNKLRKDCSPSEFGFGEINSYFITQFNYRDFVSLEVFGETYFSNYQQYAFTINIDIEKARILNIDELIKTESKNKLLSKIEGIINNEINELLSNDDLSDDDKETITNKIKNDNIFPLKDYPKSWMLKDDNKSKGINFNFSLGLWNPSERHLDINPDLFFTFEELKPYIKEGYKVQLGL